MKRVKENLSRKEFEEYERKFEQNILNTKGVAYVVIGDIDEEIPFSGGLLRREYFGNNHKTTKVKKDLLYLEKFSEEAETYLYDIYEYED